jgi:hypothetical protein
MSRENPYESPEFTTVQPTPYSMSTRFIVSVCVSLALFLLGCSVVCVWLAISFKSDGYFAFASEQTRDAILSILGTLSLAAVAWIIKWRSSLPIQMLLCDSAVALASELSLLAVVVLV